MDNKVLEVALQAYMDGWCKSVEGTKRCIATWDDETDVAHARAGVRAALLAGVKVLLEPLAAEWRATASDLYFPDDSDCCARGRIEVENGTLRDCADQLESIYAPSLGEGDGR